MTTDRKMRQENRIQQTGKQDSKRVQSASLTQFLSRVEHQPTTEKNLVDLVPHKLRLTQIKTFLDFFIRDKNTNSVSR